MIGLGDTHYDFLWQQAKLSPGTKEMAAVDWTVSKVLAGFPRYLSIQKQLGIPWFLVGAIHGLEASFNFNTCLHNGDPLGHITTHVPIGLGPFMTWESAALDALKAMSSEKSWTLMKCLAHAELYNGLGYLKYHPNTPSPYVWACTTAYPGHGKYSSDGKFDPEATTDQCGVAAVMLAILGGVKI